MKFSIHPSQEFNPKYMKYRWEETEVASFLDAQKYIINHHWSPCVWRDGRRSKESFLYADLIGLDFDNTASIADVKEKMRQRGAAYIIAPTKSHGRDAGDRFRLVLRMKDRCEEISKYESIVRQLVEQLNADGACIDAARFFWRSKFIDDSKDGFALRFSHEAIKDLQQDQLVQQMKSRIATYRYETYRQEPKWFREFFESGQLVLQGGRSNSLYAVGRKGAGLGIPFEALLQRAETAPIDWTDFPKHKIRESLLNGYRKGSNN